MRQAVLLVAMVAVVITLLLQVSTILYLIVLQFDGKRLKSQLLTSKWKHFRRLDRTADSPLHQVEVTSIYSNNYHNFGQFKTGSILSWQ